MNILIISHEYPPIGGGGANACFNLAENYVRLGHSVTIVTSSFRHLPEEEKSRNFCIIRVKALRRNEDKSTFLEMFSFLWSAGCRVTRLVRRKRFDVCQVFFGIPSGPVGLYLKKRYGIPYIVRFGGGDIPGAQKRFTILYKFLSPIIRTIWKNADALVANSEMLKEKALGFEDRYPVTVIPNGVDYDFFNRERIEKTTDKQIKKTKGITILFVSRLIQGKGLQHIIPELNKINHKCEQEVRLVIVGDGPYRKELEKIAEEAGVVSRVSFEGKRDREELCQYYRSADLFILPSVSEGMPNVVLEAMSMGLPVLMTPCGGSNELISNNGHVVPIENFVDTLIDLCNDERSRSRMGEQSILLVRTKFGWQEKAKDYMKIFEKSVK